MSKTERESAWQTKSAWEPGWIPRSRLSHAGQWYASHNQWYASSKTTSTNLLGEELDCRLLLDPPPGIRPRGPRHVCPSWKRSLIKCNKFYKPNRSIIETLACHHVVLTETRCSSKRPLPPVSVVRLRFLPVRHSFNVMIDRYRVVFFTGPPLRMTKCQITW